ncbi:hypothetical protein Acsp03_16710 [Actinomadura sp. NBRC 104412]|uniref:hypothetical protein n=1 Tax=Actinomadura sp. NBRC 104412 TaxID=3032203 RepID=UPI0024A074F2|nr:hypothetical protein [Actinomadura sp. NBRC 104412]GLZ04205.1 hypothetical protein Acsp03_16710 [Actinomadura sp. NBRC 104412]
MEDPLHAYRIGIRTVWERLTGEARRNGVEPDAEAAMLRVRTCATTVWWALAHQKLWQVALRA